MRGEGRNYKLDRRRRIVMVDLRPVAPADTIPLAYLHNQSLRVFRIFLGRPQGVREASIPWKAAIPDIVDIGPRRDITPRNPRLPTT